MEINVKSNIKYSRNNSLNSRSLFLLWRLHSLYKTKRDTHRTYVWWMRNIYINTTSLNFVQIEEQQKKKDKHVPFQQLL